MTKENKFMAKAIALSEHAVLNNEGGPFGCVVVRNGEIIGRGNNNVLTKNDPTAHAEIMAIRDAAQNIGTFNLEDCEIFTSCEPCPMCVGAIYWAKIKTVYYANTKTDAAESGFDDAFIYQELEKPIDKRKVAFKKLNVENAKNAFRFWNEKEDKIKY